MRTTVYLPKDFVEAVKLEAMSRKMTLTSMMYEGLKKEIRIEPKRKKRMVFKTYDLGNPKYVFRRADAYE
ncbi:MAG: hypothetical protein G01um101416_1009 [Microgenomates group bacterium Gr01-1014_16]|nr:MAG: hypothetical protein G01um101416_1009 [Microgenomates group bacterium Gr01-1014_16]